MYEHITQKTAANMDRIKPIIGNEYPDILGNTWVLHSCNDLGVPYFHKKGRKTLYTVSHCRSIDSLLGANNG